MGIYNFIYNIFSVPFGYALHFLYQINGHNYLAAVIIFAVIVKLILLPSSISQQKNTAKTQRMNARLQRIREKYADDQQAQNEAIQEFYSKEGFSSMSSGCGTLLIQFPIIIGLYGAIYKPLSYILRIDHQFGEGTIAKLTKAVSSLIDTSNARSQAMMEIQVVTKATELKDVMTGISQNLYSTIHDFSQHFTALGFNFGDIPATLIKEGNKAVLIIPIVAFATAMISSIYSLIHTRRMPGSNQQTMMSMGCMMLFMPLMSLWLAYQFPVGIGIYWAVNSLLGALQMVLLDIFYPPNKVVAEVMIDESIVRRQKEVLSKQAAEAMAEAKN